MQLAFLGLGAIGAPMARHLAGPHDLTVWNRTAERARSFGTETGARVAGTPREAASGAAAVITCLPTSREVSLLLEGPDGLAAGMEPGSLLIDCTSGDPETSRQIAARLARQGIGFVDAPVSGGTDGAAAAALTVMVGGSAEDFARARPVLEAFGKRIEHMGPVGAGHAMKAVNNALLGVNILAVAEGAIALARAGVEPERALAVLNASSGRSFVSEKLVPERVLTGLWPNTFRLALLDKDIGIACDLARQQGVAAPLLDLTLQLFHQARARLGESADYLEAIRLQEEQAGVALRTAPAGTARHG